MQTPAGQHTATPDALNGPLSRERDPGGPPGAETGPEAATRAASGAHEAAETTANPAPLTDERLTAIEERAAKATPGPWERYAEYGPHFFASTSGEYLQGVGDLNFGVGDQADADEAFVQRAREDVDELLAEVARLRARLALATVLEIPRPGTGLPLQLRLSYGRTDRWAICDREGRRWHREYGWVYEAQGIRDEAERDATRYTLAEALPLAQRIAAGEVQS